jgi:hypothetical protein
MASPQIRTRSTKLAARTNQAFNSLVMGAPYQNASVRGPRYFHRAPLSQPSLAVPPLNAPTEGSQG